MQGLLSALPKIRCDWNSFVAGIFGRKWRQKKEMQAIAPKRDLNQGGKMERAQRGLRPVSWEIGGYC